LRAFSGANAKAALVPACRVRRCSPPAGSISIAPALASKKVR